MFVSMSANTQGFNSSTQQQKLISQQQTWLSLRDIKPPLQWLLQM
jgi:hypothetical protein